MQLSERAHQKMSLEGKKKKDRKNLQPWLMTGSVKISFTICINAPATSF